MGKKSDRIIAASFLAYMYFLFLIYLTLLASERIDGRLLKVNNINLKLFSKIIWEIERCKVSDIKEKIFYIREFLGNLLLFFPYPFAFYIIKKQRLNSLKMFSLMFLNILAIETIQLVFKVGVFDIDDIVLNSLGGLTGLYVFNFMYKKRNRK